MMMVHDVSLFGGRKSLDVSFPKFYTNDGE